MGSTESWHCSLWLLIHQATKFVFTSTFPFSQICFSVLHPHPTSERPVGHLWLIPAGSVHPKTLQSPQVLVNDSVVELSYWVGLCSPSQDTQPVTEGASWLPVQMWSTCINYEEGVSTRYPSVGLGPPRPLCVDSSQNREAVLILL